MALIKFDSEKMADDDQDERDSVEDTAGTRRLSRHNAQAIRPLV